MTDCNRQPLLFSSLGRQETQADFAGGTLTSDAGGLLLREVDRQLGLIDAFSACLTDPRDPAKVVHEQRTMLAQRIFGLALGYEDLNDHDELRRESIPPVAVGGGVRADRAPVECVPAPSALPPDHDPARRPWATSPRSHLTRSQPGLAVGERGPSAPTSPNRPRRQTPPT